MFFMESTKLSNSYEFFYDLQIHEMLASLQEHHVDEILFEEPLFSCSGLAELLGILVGHLYFFLMFKYPQDFGGRALLKTPDIL